MKKWYRKIIEWRNDIEKGRNTHGKEQRPRHTYILAVINYYFLKKAIQ